MDQNMLIVKNLKMVKEFINHNVQLKNINKETTVEELLKFIDSVEQGYVPLILKVVENYIKENNI
jgi:hypothetical protein